MEEKNKNNKSLFTYTMPLFAPKKDVEKMQAADILEGFEGRVVSGEKITGIYTDNIFNCEIFIFYRKKTSADPARFSLLHRNTFTSQEQIQQAHSWAGTESEVCVIRHTAGPRRPALFPEAKSVISDKPIKFITLPDDKTSVLAFLNVNGDLNYSFDHSRNNSNNVSIVHHPHALTLLSGYMFHTALLPLYAHMETSRPSTKSDKNNISDEYVKKHRPVDDQLLLFDTQAFNQRQNFDLIQPFQSLHSFITTGLKEREFSSISLKEISNLIKQKIEKELSEIKIDSATFRKDMEKIVDINILQASFWFCYLTHREKIITEKDFQHPIILHCTKTAQHYPGSKGIRLTSLTSSLFHNNFQPFNVQSDMRQDLKKLQLLCILSFVSIGLLYSLVSDSRDASYTSSIAKCTGLMLMGTLIFAIFKKTHEPAIEIDLESGDDTAQDIVKKSI